MTDGISEEVLERLEAEALTADAEAEELTIAIESNIEEKESEVEELEADLDEKESEVEELEADLDEKEKEIESLSESVESVSETYAEELAKHSKVDDKEDYLSRYEFEELQEKYETLEETSAPAPNSGDPGAGFQNANGEGEGEGTPEEPELTEMEELAASSFKKRSRRPEKDYWADIAEEIEEEGFAEGGE